MNNPFKYRIPICTTTLGNFNWSRLIQNCFRAQVRQQLNEWHKFKRLQMCTKLQEWSEDDLYHTAFSDEATFW